MKNKAITLGVLFCCLVGILEAQIIDNQANIKTGPWKDIQELNISVAEKATPQLPEKFRLLELDVEALTTMLSALPPSFSKKDSEKPTMEIEIPMPDGSTERFLVFSDPIMHPDLAKQYPEIQTFAGQSLSDPTATIRMDLSPHGFNAQILTDKRGSIYISPVTVGDNRHNISYFKQDSKRGDAWKCLTEAQEMIGRDQIGQESFAGLCGNRREYRLALACTGEYAGFHGGTIALALAAMNTTMNRVNGIYGREASMRMNIIANTSLLIFLDGTTDPYDNGDGSAMLGQNQATCDAIITSANYDIGHVFSTGGGGIATLGVPCTGSKARGVTGRLQPIGDAFDIDYVAHEMGHQFGGRHTFNENSVGECNAANVNPGTAFEPGSGTTIMAYAGICGSSNVQANSDAYFHAISLQEIGNYVTSGAGSTCGTLVAVSNGSPTVNAGANFTIPAGTPFRLTASGTDPNGHPLTYCWEQMDNQIIPQPPAASAVGGPLFRSFSPVSSPIRYFPRLPVILGNAAASVWEVLPSASRSLNFRVTGRDNIEGGGCTEEDDMVATVVGTAGPFTVNSIGLVDNCLVIGEKNVINWSVANTNLAPINCTDVDIWLSTDGGNNFTVQLANDVPNDGTNEIIIPNGNLTTQGRIMVIAANNVFFNVNNANFRIVECVINRVVTDNPASGTYKAGQNLETMGDVVVLSGTQARFFAGESVRLKPGFWARAGSDFQAKIVPCNSCLTTKPQDLVTISGESDKVYFHEIPANERTKAAIDSPLKAFAFPNPFDQSFNISFDLESAGKVEITLYDLNGRQVQVLYQNEVLSAGRHQIPVQAAHLVSGVYDCRIISQSYRAQIKLVKIN